MTDTIGSIAHVGMENRQFPGLYQSVDAASLQAQKTYLLLQRVHLWSLILGSAVGAFTAFAYETIDVWFHSAIAIILALGLLILWVSRSRDDEKVWFDCRAIGESAKTATWRYMMCAPPFSEDNSVDERFISELREIRNARPECNKDIAGYIDADSPAITEFMTKMRASVFEDRRAFYIDWRLRDQKTWYSNKANLNARRGTHWFWATTGLQALAIILAIIEATSGSFQFNVVTLLITCTAAVAAWSQMKRHSELAQTYSLAAQELGELDSIAVNLSDEDEFSQLIEQVEEAISREHTMWCARRDVRLTGNGVR